MYTTSKKQAKELLLIVGYTRAHSTHQRRSAHLIVVSPAHVVGPLVVAVVAAYQAGEVGVAAPVDVQIRTSHDLHRRL